MSAFSQLFVLSKPATPIARTNGQNIPTVALTAYTCEEDSRRVLQAGYDAYLPKPVEPSKLIETIIEISGNFNFSI